MNTVRKFALLRRASLPTAAIMLVSTLAVFSQHVENLSAAGCPSGYGLYGAEEARMSPYSRALDVATGVDPLCVLDKHPESASEVNAMFSQRAAIQSAPDGIVPAGAGWRATRQKDEVRKRGQSFHNGHEWVSVGNGPLQSGDPGYGVSSLGLIELAGRVNDLVYVPPTDFYQPDTLIASVGQGGVWISDQSAANWASIGDDLPTQVIGAVAYTPAGGGTIFALTGDDSLGFHSKEGLGGYFTIDGGHRWHKAKGLPEDAFGFKMAVDPSNPKIVYAATSSGLYRSTDVGRSFRNVNLPTGDCAGKSNRVKGCLLANYVTDVIVIEPGGFTDEEGGRVLAAVGWRGGNATNADGTVQSPANGFYVSETGAANTFERTGTVGLPEQARIGRTEIGAASGPDQNHNYVYALIQDAVLLRGGLPGIDAPGADRTLAIPTVLHGIYVSPDFGATWTMMAQGLELQSATTGSALGVTPALGLGPGVQAWYNLWIKPDPTRAAGGIPTRLVFGLEEVWQNEGIGIPLTGKTSFKVIGRYFSGRTCLFLVQDVPCATNRQEALTPTTTTHPDQHTGLFIPDGSGGVTLIAGNDGGVYRQYAPATVEFQNANWGLGNNRGFNTLMPYDAVRSADGTIWMGLQDNGTAKIVDVKKNGRIIERGRQIMAFGGDGFFVATHPTNGKIAYGETPGGSMRATQDGGYTWSAMSPPITAGQFSNPFVMDPFDPDHLLTAGNEVVVTTGGPGTGASDWAEVFDLGTAKHPGDAEAEPVPDEDPVNQMTAVDLVGAAGYVGFCGVCDILNSKTPFLNGLATNVGGAKAPKKGSPDGWHIAKANGLPNRWISSIAIHRMNPKIVTVTLGGYGRRWTPPGTLDKPDAKRVGSGHVYVSVDAGENFFDISANLPNAPVNWVTLRNSQIIVATDYGVFISVPEFRCDDYSAPTCNKWQQLGNGLPATPVHTVRLSHGDPNLLIAAAHGRGVWAYRFSRPAFGPPKGTPRIPPPAFLGKVVAGPFGFELDAEGWTTETNNDLTTWERSAPGDGSANSFQVQHYADESTATLRSPKMTLTERSTVRVTWSEWINTEPDFDFMWLDWSADGKKWNPVHASNGVDPTFNEVTTEFVAPKGGLWLRFRMSSDALVSSPPFTGVWIDDIRIER